MTAVEGQAAGPLGRIDEYDTAATTPERASRSSAWRKHFVAANDGRCHYCNRRGISDEVGPDDRPWHVDHKTPLARGGADDDSNLVLACKRCNLTKGVQPYAQFRDFARAAFWTPDDWRVSEYDLDWLIWTYTKIDSASSKDGRSDPQDPVWRVSEDGGVPTLGYLDVCGDRVVVLTGGESYTDRVLHLQLVALMHRHLPALIAEIRMLRGESAGGVA